MNLEKVIFGFFIVLAATLNFGFFVGDIDNPAHHDVYELFAALVVSLIATVLKFGDCTQIGAGAPLDEPRGRPAVDRSRHGGLCRTRLGCGAESRDGVQDRLAQAVRCSPTSSR